MLLISVELDLYAKLIDGDAVMYQLFHILVESKLRYGDEFIRRLSSLLPPIDFFKLRGVYFLL